MNKNKGLKLDNNEKDFVSIDDIKSNQSILNNSINNNYSIDNTDNGLKPSIRKTKTSKATSPKKEKKNKKNQTQKINKNYKTNNDKKVKFTDKVDIVKVECWKQYNLEQTADECEYGDDYLDVFENECSFHPSSFLFLQSIKNAIGLKRDIQKTFFIFKFL